MFIFRRVEKVHFNRFVREISDKSSELVTERNRKVTKPSSSSHPRLTAESEVFCSRISPSSAIFEWI
jgi:hypothetical protein